MESKIAAVAGMRVECNVLGGKNGRGVMVTIIIDGTEKETTSAAQRIAQMAGSLYEDGGYDTECAAYFCGINY